MVDGWLCVGLSAAGLLLLQWVTAGGELWLAGLGIGDADSASGGCRELDGDDVGELHAVQGRPCAAGLKQLQLALLNGSTVDVGGTGQGGRADITGIIAVLGAAVLVQELVAHRQAVRRPRQGRACYAVVVPGLECGV